MTAYTPVVTPYPCVMVFIFIDDSIVLENQLFWDPANKAEPLGDHVLQIGVYVWINRSWQDHPFFTNRFLIKTESELKIIKALGKDNIFWVPAKSKVTPFPPSQETKVEKEATVDDEMTEIEKAIQEKKQKVEEQRKALKQTERRWEKSAEQVRESIAGLKNNPRQYAPKIQALANTISDEINHEQVYLLLLGESRSYSLQNHLLNVMTLTGLLGKSMGLPENLVSELVGAAIVHDAGQTQLPKELLTAKVRNKVEEARFKDHVRLSVELMQASGAFSQFAIDSVQDHHEHDDGSGYPMTKKGSAIHIGGRILSIVSTFDRLTSPASSVRGLSPKVALQRMWTKERHLFDSKILSAFIKLLGVYPPGTVVKLSNDEIAIVISPGESALHPKVLIFDPNVPKEEAEILDCKAENVDVLSSIEPDALPDEIFTWIHPDQQSNYYFSR